ncbi:MAG: flavodoxin-dependent (E)-4-hydroxy-3-methylbut-2-enyl-diphosphate synthase [Acutalibacter sp.]
MQRRSSKQVMAGGVAIGGGAPITVQSMLNVPSTDIQGSVEQALRLERAGCLLQAAIPAKRPWPSSPPSGRCPSLVADLH